MRFLMHPKLTVRVYRRAYWNRNCTNETNDTSKPCFEFSEISKLLFTLYADPYPSMIWILCTRTLYKRASGLQRQLRDYRHLLYLLRLDCNN